jgi:hypothetical protein
MAAVLVLAAPAAARADGFITPFVGADFSGDAGTCPTLATNCSENRLTYGVGVGFMVGGIVGFEGEFAYAPHFFGEATQLSDNFLSTAMGNVLLGIPIGPVRPYGTVGFGVLHTDVNQSATGLYNAYSNNSFAMNTGGGVMILFSQHVGIRGDLRYVRTLQALQFSQFGFTDKQLQFGRGYFGVVFRF